MPKQGMMQRQVVERVERGTEGQLPPDPLQEVQRYMQATPEERRGMVMARRVQHLQPNVGRQLDMPWIEHGMDAALRRGRATGNMKVFDLKARVAVAADAALKGQMSGVGDERQMNSIYQTAVQEKDFAKHLYKSDKRIRTMLDGFVTLKGKTEEQKVDYLHLFMQHHAVRRPRTPDRRPGVG